MTQQVVITLNVNSDKDLYQIIVDLCKIGTPVDVQKIDMKQTHFKEVTNA